VCMRVCAREREREEEREWGKKSDMSETCMI